MTMSDPIADMLTRIRNANTAKLLSQTSWLTKDILQNMI